MYNIAICEDEKVQADELIGIIEKYKENTKIKFNIDYFQSGEELIENGYEKYHIIFMDIQMKKLDGIETAKIIRKTNETVKIIFLTSHDKYWAEGYKVVAFRYLLKPIKEAELLSELKDLLVTLNKERSYINFTENGRLIKILISDIKYIVIDQRRVAIHTNNGTFYSNLSLSYFTEILTLHNFAKPHNSYLVNLRYVSLLNKDKLTLLDGEEIYISKRKYKDFKDVFTVFLGSM